MNPANGPVALEQWRARARSYLQARQLPEAQAALEQVVRQAPHDLAASIDLADILFQQGRLQASTRPLLEAMRRLPRNAPLILSLVQHLVARGEIVAA
ncbi:tetratricopeptide repeat protein, partial [Frateuria sp. YIM B11624]|uniref:tetratricopeptide repeat protein n=1 Tax=Frateuria sp. YIM B11624 TaxID=3143185 RepID=UPI003C716F6A